MIPCHTGIDFPNQIIAGNDSADCLVYIGYARSWIVLLCHAHMLGPSPDCVKIMDLRTPLTWTRNLLMLKTALPQR